MKIDRCNDISSFDIVFHKLYFTIFIMTRDLCDNVEIHMVTYACLYEMRN